MSLQELNRDYGRSFGGKVLFTIFTTGSMTGTPISTPTTVASAAPELKPKRLIATATPAAELGLLDEGASNEAILDAVIEHPILVNRSIVCTPKGVRLCRPSEAVVDLLDRFPPGPFHKEDGKLLIDHDGRRVG